MLRFAGLSKSFGRKSVFRSAAGSLAAGTYALQGANGSGKSTLLGLLCGAIEPDAGAIWIDGVDMIKDPLTARRRLAYAPDESSVYPFMSGRDLLDFVAMARSCRVDHSTLNMAEEFGLTPHLATSFAAMSLGTQKKFLLCAAWIGGTPLMLLDEPSNGLDLRTRDLLAQRIAERPGLTLFASHDSAFVNSCGARVIRLDEFIASAA